MPKLPLGQLELEVLRFIADHGPISVGEAAQQFGEPRGLARTTILTVMERLRRKGYLGRSRQGAVYQYLLRVEKSAILRGLVEDFVENTLAGSVSPFVAYLVEAKNLSEEEREALRKLVQEMAEEEKA